MTATQKTKTGKKSILYWFKLAGATMTGCQKIVQALLWFAIQVVLMRLRQCAKLWPP